jgi:hypothetical protein
MREVGSRRAGLIRAALFAQIAIGCQIDNTPAFLSQSKSIRRRALKSYAAAFNFKKF